MLWQIIRQYKLSKSRLLSRMYKSQFRYCDKTVYIERLGKLIGAKYVTIGKSSDIQWMTYLTAWDSYGSQHFLPEIVIGNDCHIGAFNHITCINRIEIGDGFVSGKWVTITDNSHGDSHYDDLCLPVSQRSAFSKGPVIIGKNVWVGDKVTILPNVTIGDSVIIGANSVVTKDIPSFCIACGNPARIIKIIK